MKKNFDLILNHIIEAEGGFVNNKNDSGGPTNMGLTLGLMKRLKMDIDKDGDVDVDDVKLVNADHVREVFRREFWDRIGGDDLPAGIDLQAASFAFTSGPGRAKALTIYTDNEDYFAWRIRFYYSISREGKNKEFWGGWAARSVKEWLLALSMTA